MNAKPQCQFAEDSTELPRCERESTRKWGDHWFCEVHGGREKATCEISQTAEPDPVPTLIAELLAFEGLAPETRTLIELALEAQKKGAMPDLSPITEGGAQ